MIKHSCIGPSWALTDFNLFTRSPPTEQVFPISQNDRVPLFFFFGASKLPHISVLWAFSEAIGIKGPPLNKVSWKVHCQARSAQLSNFRPWWKCLLSSALELLRAFHQIPLIRSLWLDEVWSTKSTHPFFYQLCDIAVECLGNVSILRSNNTFITTTILNLEYPTH